ncbi:MAG: porin family protein [Sphingomonadaceae bacterium]
MKHVHWAAAAALLLGIPAAAPADAGPWVAGVIGLDRISIEDEGRTGFLYGIQGGYDVDIVPVFFLGLQAGIHGATTGVTESGLRAESGRDIEVLGRFGGRIGPATRVYGLAGYANARLNLRSQGLVASTGFDGFRVGAGLEQSFGPLFAKAEYRYTGFSGRDIFDVRLDGPDRHQFLTGVGLRF